MTLTQVLLILRARMWSALAVFALAVGAAVVLSLVLPKKYAATASIVIDVRSPDPILGAILPLIGTGYMATQVDILKSDKVAMQVVKDLGLDRNRTAREEYEAATAGQGPIELWLARLLQKNLEVKPSRDSNVLEISYTGVDPKFAAIIANAFAKAYMDTSLAMRVEPARQYAGWFDGQIKVLRDNLEQAQAKLSDYQRRSGIVATDERMDVESARLSELSTQVIGLQTQSADSRSRQGQVRAGTTESLQEVLSHPLVQSLKADVARLEAKRQDLLAQYGANYPQLERTEAELRSLRERLDAETAKVIAGIATTNQVNTQREGEVRRALEAQRAKVMAMKQQRDEQAVLVREVESAQRAYDAVSNRLTPTTLESQSSQTNVYLLSAAVEPNTHSRPRLLLNVAVAIVLGFVLGTGLAVGTELIDRRVRSELDLAGVFDAPVLVSIDPDTRGPGARRLLGLLTAEDVRFALSRQFDFPYLKPGGDQLSDELVAAHQPLSAQTESIRALRSQLLLRWLGEEPKGRCLALVSAGRREGRSRLAANLAIVFAQLGERTLLVDGDLRHPRQHALFRLDNGTGLSSALAGRGHPTLYRIASLASLSVLPSGPPPPNPQELLSRTNFLYLLSELREKFDVVILDSPAADRSADAYLIAACAGAAVVLARRNATRHPKLQRVAARLAAARATVVGSVLNEF